MASSAEIGARMTLNSRQFLSQFSGTIDQATARARDGGRQIGAALGEEAGAGLRNLAGNIPVIGSSLTALSGPLLGVAAGVGAVSAAFALGITEAESYGDATRQLDAVLKATGNTTGLTSQQLRDFADELEGSFAIGAEEILKAEQVLSSFGGVAGSTFTDAIRLAGDLSAVYGGDLSSNSEKLGTVLQNLAQGSVDGLSKGFKFLGVAQIEAIEALAKSGQTYEAQRALLDALKNTVGGAGEANAGGLSGAFFRLKDAFGDGARQLATDTGAYEGAIGALDGMTSAVERNLNALERIRRDGIGTEFVRELRELAGLPVGADAPRVAAAKPFTASDRARVGLGGVDDIAARAAADTARAEGDAARATEALAAAAKKVADEQERAGKAVLAQEKALRDLIADAEFQASLAFKTKDAAEQLLAIRRAERAVGRELTAQERDRLLIAGDRARIGTAGAVAGDQARARVVAGSADNQSLSSDARVFRDSAKELADTLNTQMPKFTTVFDSLERALEDIGDSIVGQLENLPQNVVGNVAQNTLNRLLNVVLKPIEKLLDLVLSPLENTSGLGALGGAGIGYAVGGPLGALAGLLIGGFIEALAGKDKFVDVNPTISNGRVSGALKFRSDEKGEQGQEILSAFAGGLTNLAQLLGGTLKDGVKLATIGVNKDKNFFINPTGGNFLQPGVVNFKSQDEAIIAGLRDAIAKGAVAGIDASVARLLATGDFETQATKAATLSQALRLFAVNSDPIGEAVKALNKEFSDLRDIMIEAGSSQADMNKASDEYERQLEAVRTASEQATASLRGFLSSLNFGSSSPLSLTDQRRSATAAFEEQRGRIGTAGFNQGAFVAAGQRLIDIEEQVQGRTDGFFTVFDRVQAETTRAINAITNASAVQGDNPFARATASATQATAENTAALVPIMANLPQTISDAISAALAALGGAGGFVGGDTRGFVA